MDVGANYAVRCACPCRGHIITCGFLECLVFEVRLVYTSTGPPQINALSFPQSNSCAGEARQVFHGTARQNSLAGEYIGDPAKLRKQILKWDTPDADPQSKDWRPKRSEFGCYRLKSVAISEPQVAASARQMPPRDVPLYLDGCLSFFHDGDE